MGRRKQEEEEEEEFETDSGSEYEEEYETDSDADEPSPAPASSSKGNSKEAEPCKNYRVDTTAAKFGTCKCGWAKVDHDGPKANKAAEALGRLRKAGADDAVQSGDGPCAVFRLDTTASKFGMCKCGHHQSEHGAKRVDPAREALKSLRARNSGKASAPKYTGKPCDNFVVDPQAAEFGTCRCGFKKMDHGKKKEDAAAAMLRKLKERNAEANERADQLAVGMVDMDMDDDDEDGPGTAHGDGGGWASNRKKKKQQEAEARARAEAEKAEARAGSAGAGAAKACCVVQ